MLWFASLMSIWSVVINGSSDKEVNVNIHIYIYIYIYIYITPNSSRCQPYVHNDKGQLSMQTGVFKSTIYGDLPKVFTSGCVDVLF